MDHFFYFTADTTDEEMNSWCRYEMISAISQWHRYDIQEEDFFIDTSISDLRANIKEIHRLFQTEHRPNSVSLAAQENVQTLEIRFRSNQLHDKELPKQDHQVDSSVTLEFFNKRDDGGLKSVPETSDSELLGMNVNMMMAKPLTPSLLRPPTKGLQTQVPKQKLTLLPARFEIAPNNTSAINVPLVATQLFCIFKKADRTLRLLSWVPDEKNDFDAIDQEEDLPILKQTLLNSGLITLGS